MSNQDKERLDGNAVNCAAGGLDHSDQSGLAPVFSIKEARRQLEVLNERNKMQAILDLVSHYK